MRPPARRQRRALSHPARSLVVAILGLGLAGCAHDDPDLILDALTPIPGGAVSLASDVQPIFTANCAISGCHAGSFPEQGMSLEAGNLYDPQTGIVSVPSVQAPGLDRAEPGSAELSYLVHKIQGTQGTVGGTGERMPRGAAALPDAAIQVIRAWIDQGAQDN